jgi:glycosyltransferase involved in cell wall biosynthesis
VPWEGFAAALDAALQLPREELAAMGGRGRAWVARDYSWHRAATLLQAFYDQLRHARR